jgi:uncharacterized surface protein with fasciclin (FAS1) repeats
VLNRILPSLAAAALIGSPLAAHAADTMAAAPAPVAAAAAPATPIIPAHGDIVETMKAAGNFTILLKALDATNLTGLLKTAGPLTLIAPTDAAFQAMPAGALDNLMKPDNASQLQALLAYHLINAAAPPSKIAGSKGPIPSATGQQIDIDASGAPIKFNDADVVGESTVSNGTIYAVDKVLTPKA